MRRIWQVLVLAAVILPVALGTPAGSVMAEQTRSIRVETIKSQTPNGRPAVALVVNGMKVAQLAKDQRSRTPLHNISVAATLIAAAYRNGPAELTVQATDNTERRYALFLNGKVLLVATDMEGKAWGADPEELASTWRQNLIDAWNLPPEEPVAPEPAPAPENTAAPDATPVTPSAEPSLSGTFMSASTVVRADPALANLTVSRGHRVYEPPEATQYSGGSVNGGLTALVTGTTGTGEPLRNSIDSALRSYTGAGARDQLSWEFAPNGGQPSVEPGQRKSVKVSYQLNSGGSVPESATVDVMIENRTITIPRESYTFFSNSPERVVDPQLLYYADLPARQSGRLVYHHQNQNGGSLTLLARVLNPGSEPVNVHVVPGMCDPDINTFFVGFKSAEVFWKNLNSGSGYILQVPAGGQANLAVQNLKPGYTGSGYFKLSNLSDTGLRLETMALAPNSAPPAQAMHNTPLASHSVYPAPYHVVTSTFTAGDPWLYLRLGEDDPQSITDDSILDGCYGMTHSFHVELRNPRDYPALVFVVLRASAGEVKGQFFIDDEYVVTPLVASGEEQLLKEIPLKPGETKLLKIKALPLNGGFYPASIILRQSRQP
ncbi:hypothetical protein JW859_12030 [bacterium]|nr:hypothetical protein [bacterium]